MTKQELLAAGMLSGTMIGAGIFSLPFVFYNLGFLLGFFYLSFFSFVYFVVHTRYAEVLRKKGEGHHFFHLLKNNFSHPWSDIAPALMILRLVFVMAVFLILVSGFSSLIFGEAGLLTVAVFWGFATMLIFSRLSLVGLAELLATGLILFIALVIVFMGSGASGVVAFPEFFDLHLFLLPFGPILFAFSGRAAISGVLEVCKKGKRALDSSVKRAILLGSALPVAIYSIFVVGVFGVAEEITPDTISGLTALPEGVKALIGVAGIVALFTSYVMNGENLFDNLRTDVIPGRKNLVAVVVSVMPILLLFLGFRDFLMAVSVVGGVFLTLEAIFINRLWEKTTGAVVWKTAPIYLIFGVALAYEVLGKFLF